MAYDKNTLRKIYDRTTGYCHICKKKLSFKNYGKTGKRGAWEVEHSHPRSSGGTNHLNNLYAACISCNNLKGIHTTQTARSWNNRTRAPLSKVRREKAKCASAIGWGIVGAGIGAVGGPVGMLLGAGILGKAGYDAEPDR